MQQAHMQPQNEPQAETQKNCLTDLTLPKLTDYIKSIGQPAFRAKQIFKWIHQKQATDFSAMTDQPKALLAQFAQNCTLAVPTIRRRQQSKDGTVKYLLQLADGNCIETVLMRYHYGNTVCVSTQVGCAMGCRFCASTQAGRVRDLTSGEIAAEIYTAQKDTGERVSHIVLMGIGEPLHNFDNVMDFLDIISCPEGVNIGMRNISLSTCGLVPGIDKLAERTKDTVDPEAYRFFLERIPGLSKTEREIFDYYVSGLSTKEILESANIKESTLKYHNSHIYEKLNVKSRKELLVYISLMNRSKNGGNDCDTGAKAK